MFPSFSSILINRHDNAAAKLGLGIQCVWIRALWFGIVSAIPLPLGAWLGLMASPVNKKLVASLMGFGAGALLFAVTIELYGDTLHDVDNPKCTWEAVYCIIFTVVGAGLFVVLNRFVTAQHSAIHGALGGQQHGADPLGGQCDLEKTPLNPKEQTHSVKNVALSMWLGILLDGIPESIFIGFLTMEGAMSFTFLAAVFVSNFPEAFSSGALMKEQGWSKMKIIGLWSFTMLMTGFLAALTTVVVPHSMSVQTCKLAESAVEGVAGGAMLAMVLSTMVPDAFSKGGDLAAGLVTVLGFLAAAITKVVSARV